MYLGDTAVVHLVEVAHAPTPPENLSLEHFAFQATGLKRFLAKLESKAVEARVSKLPNFPIVQVNLFDPEGNHIHVDFQAD